MTKPPRTVLTGWTRNSNEVTTAKLPPPPRSAQNKSSCSLLLATLAFPSAVTISNDRTLSQVRPYFLTSQPTPPPRASPPMPVLDITPAGTAKPKTWVSRSTSRSVAPPCTLAVWSFASTRMPFMPDRSITIPSSQSALPDTLWPPPRTATSSSFSRAKFTAATTSATPEHRAMMPGFFLIISFHRKLDLTSANRYQECKDCNQASNYSYTVLVPSDQFISSPVSIKLSGYASSTKG